MNYYNVNFVSSNFFELETIDSPNIDGITNPMVILSVVLLVVSVIFPCLIWFLRNFLRVIMKKNYDGFNRSLKWIMFGSLILFIISIILIALTAQGIV
ncbi:MAG: hypothetical protein ACRC63_02840 [Metamycoplasmataceae bacterium]